MADDSDSSGRGSSKSLLREKPEVTFKVTVENVLVEAGAEAKIGNTFNVKIEKSQRTEDLEKLSKETLHRIEKSCPHEFVETSAFHRAVKKLKSHGIVVILGRPGDGKTELGYQLLRHFRKHARTKPLALKEPEDWKCVDTGEKQMIFIDDMMNKDGWLEMLKQCTPGGEEKVKFVITSEPYLYKPGRHGLLKSAPTVDTFNLSQEEKESILETFAKHKDPTALSSDDITTAAKVAPPLGFPKACWTFFQEREKGTNLGVDFFENPLKYDKQFLKDMADRKDRRFQVLVLAMLQGGHLRPDSETINGMSDEKIALAKQSFKGKDLNAGEIRQTAKELVEDRYLKYEKVEIRPEGKEREGETIEVEMFTFLHQSIYELVFTQEFESYERESVKSAPFDLISKHVRTERSKNYAAKKVKEQWLLDRLTSEILDGNFSALSHPSLSEEKDFESHFAEHFCKEKGNVTILLKLPAPATHLDVCMDNYTMAFEESKPLSFRHMTGGHWMKTVCETTNDCLCHIASLGLTTFASKVVELAAKRVKPDRLTEALVYACTAGDIKLCELLIRKGARPQIQTAQAACFGMDDKEDLMELLLKKFKLDKVKVEEIDACCRIAVQHGHAKMLESILKRCPRAFSPKLKDLYYGCLLQCHGRYVDHSDVEGKKSKEVFTVLRRYGAKQFAHTDRDLLIAAAHGSWGIAETLIAAGAAINCQHEDEKYTPLHVAVRYGGIDVVKGFLKEGASSSHSIADVQGQCPLHWLGIELGKQIRSGYESRTNDLMKVLETALEKHPADRVSDLLSRPDKKGHNPLHYIFGEMEEEDISIGLPEKKSAESYDKKTVSSYLYNVVQLLQDKRVDTSSLTDDQNRTLLHTYVTSPYCEQEVLQSLLDFYGDINMEDEDKRTPLHMYMSQGIVTPDMVDFFLNKGADVDRRDKDGITPWMQYIRRVDGQQEIVSKFLRRNIDVALTDKRKWNILHFYCSSENASVDLLTTMIENGADVKARDRKGRTALMTLCDAGNVPALEVKILIKRGCPVNDKDKEGKTALMWLCSNPIGFNADALRALLLENADPNIVDQSSQTPLHAYVSSQPKVEGRVIKLLLDRMENANVVDANQSTVLHLLIASGCATEENVSALLDAETHNILPDLLDKNGSTALHLACSHHPNREVIKKLLWRMFSADKEDSKGQTALHVYHSSWWPVEKAVVELLLQAGIKVNKKDKKGRTALHLHCRRARQVNKDIDQDVVSCHRKHGFDLSSTD